MTPPSKEQARQEMDDALKLIDFNGPDWKCLRDWLGWRKYELSLSAMAAVDGAKQAELRGMSKICQELLNMKSLQTP